VKRHGPELEGDADDDKYQAIDEQRALRDRIDGLIGGTVDVATSCGLGRRSRDDALTTIDLAAALTDPGT